MLYDPLIQRSTLYNSFTILSQRSTARLRSYHNALGSVYSFVTTVHNTFAIPSQRCRTRSPSSRNALRPFYNALRHVHNPLCNALQPSYDGLQHVHDPVTTLYNAFAIPITTLYDTFTIPLRCSTTLLQFRHNAVQPFYNALQRVHDPFYSFVYNVIQPFHNALRHVHNPITTLYNAFTIPSTVSLQCHTTLLRRSTTLLATSYNPPTTLYDPSTVSLQRRTTLLRRSTTLLGCGRKKGEKKNKSNARKRSGDRETGKKRDIVDTSTHPFCANRQVGTKGAGFPTVWREG